MDPVIPQYLDVIFLAGSISEEKLYFIAKAQESTAVSEESKYINKI